MLLSNSYPLDFIITNFKKRLYFNNSSNSKNNVNDKPLVILPYNKHLIIFLKRYSMN